MITTSFFRTMYAPYPVLLAILFGCLFSASQPADASNGGFLSNGVNAATGSVAAPAGVTATGNSGAASGTTATTGTAAAPTSGYTGQTWAWSDIQKMIWQNAAIQAGVEEHAEIPAAEPGADKPDQYRATVQPGTDLNGDYDPLTTHVAPTDAKQPQPNQPVPHPPIQLEFTEYPNPLLNNFGPPVSMPFHNPQPNNDMVNPAAFVNNPNLKGAPASDLVTHEITLAAAQRAAEQLINPSFMSSQAALQGQVQLDGQAANSAGNAQFGANLKTVSQSLINVANENAGEPVAADAATKTLPQAIWMVQQIFRKVFLPIAVLLILPGAVLTQTVGMINGAIAGTDPQTPQPDSINPFTGIFRAVVAMFLIPATQLIVSYSIDIGNSLSYTVTQQIDEQAITNWSQPITNPYGNDTEAEVEQAQEQQTTLSAMTQTGYGSLQMLMNNSIMILISYQIIMVSYLFLMGPIAAAFYAWPGGVGQIFRPVFQNWLNALINLVLWRFLWCVIVLCMSTRLQWLQEIGEPTDGPWETMVFVSFMVMLASVPFVGLTFRPGDLVDQLMDKAKGATGAGGQSNAPTTRGANRTGNA
jgi:hypothetical protein